MALVLLPAIVRADGDPTAVSFEKDVLPLFKAKCFSCHDARKKTADLRLDVRKLAFEGGESKVPAIVPGKPEASELLKRLLTDDEETQMPPGGEKLPAAQIAKVKAWIADGAKWPDALANEGTGPAHWGFVAPKRPAVPKVEGATHPIDAFVRVKLPAQGLKPSQPADKVTLLRRLHLDLIGLPPTIAEVDAFLADGSPNATEKVIDNLLASPHYGERWGRLWLDAARYADSDGFEKDKPRFVTFYRDYVINAHNRDVPFNQFIVEQIAGDMLPKPTQDQIAATGFLRNSMINEEGGVDPEQFRTEAMFDRLDTVGKSILGLTVGCAQCHTHKYDPIAHTDYYRLFALLNNAHEASVTVYTPAQQVVRQELFRKAAMIRADLKHKHPDWPERLAAWEKALPPEPVWTIVKPELDTSGGQKHTLLPDGSILAGGYAPTKHTTDFTVTIPDGKPIAAIRLELLTDPTLPHGGPGRSVTGLPALTEFKLLAASADKPGEMKDVKIVSATADASAAEHALQAEYDDKTKRKRILGPIAFAVDGKDETAWSIDVGPGRRNASRKAVFVLDKPIQFAKGAVVTFKLTQNHGGWNSDDNQTHNLGRFRFSVTSGEGAQADPLPASVRAIVAKGPEGRTPAEFEQLFDEWRKSVTEFKDVNYNLESLWKDHPEGVSQLTLAEMDAGRTTKLLKRGDQTKPGDAMKPGTPGFLNPLPAGAPADRLGFARWLVDPAAPTTARAAVNRIWQAYFGRGLSQTPEDFGTQGDMPSHPELLDWLAVEFMNPSNESSTPWSLKAFHKLVTTSATYQQSSVVSADALAKDAANVWLARGARVRIDGELVRDTALVVSGLLNVTVGGDSVYPPIPMFLMQPPASYGPKSWPESKGADRYRRSVYVFRFRSILYPVLQAFDVPNGDTACVKRSRSNTPMQALVGLNEPLFQDAARGLGARMTAASGDDVAKLTHGFRRCVSRKPNADELAALTKLLAQQRKRFVAEDAKPKLLIGTVAEFPKGMSEAEAAAWVAVARVLLNLDETITKE